MSSYIHLCPRNKTKKGFFELMVLTFQKIQLRLYISFLKSDARNLTSAGGASPASLPHEKASYMQDFPCVGMQRTICNVVNTWPHKCPPCLYEFLCVPPKHLSDPLPSCSLSSHLELQLVVTAGLGLLGHRQRGSSPRASAGPISSDVCGTAETYESLKRHSACIS